MNFRILRIFLFYVILGSVFAINSNGFGDQVNWVDYSSALSDSSRPTMIILHKSWCAACKNLKPKLAENLDFEELSQKFSMVNAGEDNELHNNVDLSVDGSYIPRIFFWIHKDKYLIKFTIPKEIQVTNTSISTLKLSCHP